MIAARTVVQGAQNAMSMLITSRRRASTRVGLFEVEKAARGFVDAVVVARPGFRWITRDEGCSFTEITGGGGGEVGGCNEVNRKESPGRKPCPAAFPSRRITIDSRTIVGAEKKITAEKPIQSNSLAEEMLLENFPRQRTTYCSF